MSDARVSSALLERAARSIPGGVLGFHKLMPPEIASWFPLFAERGQGARLVDLEGSTYLDYILGKGPVILGHGHRAVQAAVVAQLEKGNLLGLSTGLEIDVAERLCSWLPGAEQVRFHKTGSDACSAAMRLARVCTGRPWILSSGYHGWHDGCSPGEPGVPDQAAQFVDFHYDLEGLERLLAKHHDEIAALFVEPQPGYLRPSFYQTLREMADAAGALLIFDEIKTGFRLPQGSVQAAVGVTPDLTTLSKAIANGYCLSCVVGRAEILAYAERTHLSTTYGVEALPFAAARATLDTLAPAGTLEGLDARGQTLLDGLDACFARHDVPAKAFGPGAMFRIGFSEPVREASFYSAAARAGVLLYPFDNHFLSLSHGDAEIRETLEIVDEVIAQSVAAHPPARPHHAVADWSLADFPWRKGFLQGVAGPDGKSHMS